MKAKITSACTMAFLAMGLLGCVTQQHLRNLQSETANVPRDASVYVSIPDDGRYGEINYTGSGQMTAQAVMGAFQAELDEAEVGRRHEDREEALSAARDVGAGYLIEPKILHWEDRATEWSGRPDKIRVLISIIDANTGEVVNKGEIIGESSWVTFGGDHPQDLLQKPIDDFAAAVVVGG